MKHTDYELTDYELCKIISLRPRVYENTTVIYKLEIDGFSLRKTNIAVSDALKMTRGDTVEIRAKAIFESNFEWIDLYLDDKALTNFIDKFGTHDIKCTLIAELEVVHATYPTFDPFVNDGEAYGYKLIKIIEKEV